MRQIRKLKFYWKVLGAKACALFVLAKLLQTTWRFSAKAPSVAHPVTLRLATTDVSVFCQVLQERHYDFDLPQSPGIIVDAGANIGLSAVFFASKYPEATILALEPESRNYELLCRNVAPYRNVITLQAALWREDRKIRLFNPSGAQDGFRTDENETLDSESDLLVAAYRMETLMSRYQFSRVNLLKLDIEGAEKEVFESAECWIARVDAIMIEHHERMKPGSKSSFAFATRDFEPGGHRGEVQMVFRS